MKINKSANFTDFAEFIVALEKIKAAEVPFSCSGNVNASENENDNDNFSINWISEEEI